MLLLEAVSIQSNPTTKLRPLGGLHYLSRKVCVLIFYYISLCYFIKLFKLNLFLLASDFPYRIIAASVGKRCLPWFVDEKSGFFFPFIHWMVY